MTFQEILASCIEALEDEKSIEFCLSAYPQHADRLEPLLRIVAHLRSLSRTQVSSGAPLVMHEFRAILASCIEALAGGKSIQFCLSTYPQHAERLEPLLQIVAHLHSQQMPQRQPLARVHGRELVAQANLKRTGQWVPTPTPSPIFQSAGFNSLFARFQQQTTVPVTQQARQSYWPNMVMTATAACLLLVASLMLQSTVSSLPGDTLYPVKRSGEQVAGLAMQAFGEPAAWQMDQVARRIDEIEILEESGRFVDPALVAEVKEEAEEVQEVIAALPPTERETAQDKWINILENHREDAEDDSAVVAVLAEPIATAQSVIAQADLLEPDPQMTPQVQVAMIPAATWIPSDPSIQTDGPLPVPTQTQQRPSTAPVGEPATSAATAPSATQPSRRATVTPQSQGANTSSRSASATATTRSMEPMLGLGPDGSIGAAKVSPTPVNTRVSTRTPQPTASLTPTKIITPTKTVMPTSGPSIVGTATNTPVATSTFTPLLLATATRPAASSPVLLPTVTNTPLPTSMPTSTPTAMASATTAPVLIPTVTPTSTSLPTVTPEPTVIEFIEATNTPLPTATPTQVSTDTPQPTATAISEPTAMPQPTATWTLEPTSTQMPTATAMPAPTFTPLPVATATSAPTSAPTWTPLPPATATSAPTWTPLPPATVTPAPTFTPLPVATATSAPTSAPTWTPLPPATATTAPTWTPLPTATATPAPTWTPLPTATATQGPTFSPLPTETPRSGEPEVPDALPEVETPTSEPTSEPTFTPLPTETPTATWTPLPTSTPSPTVVPVLSPTATPTTKPAFTPLPTDTSLS